MRPRILDGEQGVAGLCGLSCHCGSIECGRIMSRIAVRTAGTGSEITSAVTERSASGQSTSLARLPAMESGRPVLKTSFVFQHRGEPGGTARGRSQAPSIGQQSRNRGERWSSATGEAAMSSAKRRGITSSRSSDPQKQPYSPGRNLLAAACQTRRYRYYKDRHLLRKSIRGADRDLGPGYGVVTSRRVRPGHHGAVFSSPWPLHPWRQQRGTPTG